MQYKFESTLERLDNQVWYYGIIVPNEVSSHFQSKKEKRVLCSINEEAAFNCALLHTGDGRFFIIINKERQQFFRLHLGQKVSVSISPDESEYGMPLPKEMELLFIEDTEGKKVFHALTRGKQRSLLYLVSKPKKSETRLIKAVVILDFLKARNGDLDFKLLNEAFKQANNARLK